MKRKIAAIVAADIADYSRLVAQDEEETIRRLADHRAVFDDLIVQHKGRIFNTAGDAVLSEFASVVEAVRAAVDIQESLRTRNLDLPPERKLQFRMGISIGDVIERDGDLLGDGVNIAARLESLAVPGGICVSRSVHEAVANKISVPFRYLGEQRVKNLPQPIDAFQVTLAGGVEIIAQPVRKSPSQPRKPRWSPLVLVLAGVVAALAIAVLKLLPPIDNRAAPLGDATPRTTAASPKGKTRDPAKSEPEGVRPAGPSEPARPPTEAKPRAVGQPPPEPGGAFRDCAGCPELIVLAAGSFQMGAAATPFDRPVHSVAIGKSIAIGRTEVTVDEWKRCVADGPCQKPDGQGFGEGDRPVINVSWFDAKDFVTWLSGKTGKRYRLPSEAEWEYAAHGGTTTAFAWGQTVGTKNANCTTCESGADAVRTLPVKSFPPNGFGIYDMAGNAAEWVEDCWNPTYEAAPQDGVAVQAGECGQRVLRGGSFDSDAAYVKPTARFRYEADVRYWGNGFRVVRELP